MTKPKKPRKKKEQPMAVTQINPSTEAIIAKMQEMALRLKNDPWPIDPKDHAFHDPRYCGCDRCEVERGMKDGTLPLAVQLVLEAYGEATNGGLGQRPRRILVGLNVFDNLWLAINLSLVRERYLFKIVVQSGRPDSWLLDGCVEVVLSLQLDHDEIELVF
jgi:hypothetical protein